MQYSKIEWTDNTWNLWRGCTEVSPACDHCYAREIAKRNPAVLGQWGAGAPRVLGNDIYRRTPLKWNAQAEKEGVRRRVFALSMGDWLDDEVPAAWLAELVGMVYATPWLDWQLLTKRPGNFRQRMAAVYAWTQDHALAAMVNGWACRGEAPPNVWVGTTVEDQARADERVPQLLAIPARVRFLSCEPLVGAFDFQANCWNEYFGYSAENGNGWVIAGGESGHGARPMHPEWVRRLRDQCQAARVPFFFKQWGEWWPCPVGTEGRSIWMSQDGETHEEGDPGYLTAELIVRDGKKITGRELDGREWSEFPVTA